MKGCGALGGAPDHAGRIEETGEAVEECSGDFVDRPIRNYEFVWMVGLSGARAGGRVTPVIVLRRARVNELGWKDAELAAVQGSYTLTDPDGHVTTGTWARRECAGSGTARVEGDSSGAWAQGMWDLSVRATLSTGFTVIHPQWKSWDVSREVTLQFGSLGTAEEVPEWAYLVAKHSGKALDIGGASQDDGGWADQWDWADVDQQKFRVEPADGRYFRLIAKHSGKALAIADSSLSAGAALVQWEAGSGDNQRFQRFSLGRE